MPSLDRGCGRLGADEQDGEPTRGALLHRAHRRGYVVDNAARFTLPVVKTRPVLRLGTYGAAALVVFGWTVAQYTSCTNVHACSTPSCDPCQGIVTLFWVALTVFGGGGLIGCLVARRAPSWVWPIYAACGATVFAALALMLWR